MTRAAPVCSALLGLGFGLPGAYGAWYYARHGEVWTFLGFPTYGDGPFACWGLPTSVALPLSFVAVCAVEVVVGVLLWRDATGALWLVLALLPVELVFWTGFALPLGPLLGLVRTARANSLLVAGTDTQPDRRLGVSSGCVADRLAAGRERPATVGRSTARPPHEARYYGSSPGERHDMGPERRRRRLRPHAAPDTAPIP